MPSNGRSIARNTIESVVAPFVAPVVWDGHQWQYQTGGVASTDAFARQRVSEPFSLFTGKSTLDNQPLLFDDAETSGTGTGSTWTQNEASVALDVSAATAGTRVRQSKVRPSYQPGKSHRAFITFTMAAAETGLTQRVGLFDDNDGIFVELAADGTVYFVRRSYRTGSAVDTKVAQADWSLDALPELDMTKSQILYLDFEWLGVGIVRMGFVIDGVVHVCHVFRHANIAAGVYMSNPNLPVRWEIANDGNAGAAELEAICASVDSEGGFEDIGFDRSVDTGITGFTTGATTSIYPVIALRLDSLGLNAFVRPTSVNLICTSTANYRWSLLLNPTLTGTALSFADVSNSATERALPTNATTVTSENTVLASGYASDTVQARGGASIDIGQFQLGAAIDGTSDIVILAVQNLTGAAETYHASLGWRESS